MRQREAQPRANQEPEWKSWKVGMLGRGRESRVVGWQLTVGSGCRVRKAEGKSLAAD